MDKIYLVTGGEYSDWYVECYFDNRLDAEKYCADNENLGFEIHEVNKKYLTKEQEQVKLLYIHQVVFDKKNNGLFMRDEPDRYRFTRDYTKNKFRKFEISKAFHQPAFQWICFEIEEPNRKKAEKIAQDYAYQFVALLDSYTPQQAETIINDKFVKRERG